MLHYAALLDNMGLVELLIEPHREINLDAIAENHGTALQIAAHEGKPTGDEIVALLLDRGADAKIGVNNMKYGSPLHAAVAMPSSWDDEKYEDIAKIILDKDPAALHVVAGIYPTVLQAAVQGGTPAVIKLLLERESNKGIVVGKYGTPLHLAAIRGSYQKQKILIQYGAPFFTTTTEDYAGRIPLHLAISYGDFGALPLLISEEDHALLIRRDRLQRHPLHFAAGLGMSQSIKEIIEVFPDAIHDKDIDGCFPLHWVCRGKIVSRH